MLTSAFVVHKTALVTMKTQADPTVGRSAGLPSSTIRAGIIGAGFIGEVHARAIRSAGATLSRVADGSADRSTAAARRLGADMGAASAQELLASPDVDVVHICTPNHLHAPLTRLALRAGKHVICEKPLATDREDAQDLVRLADEAGVVAAVPFIYRYYPMIQEARAIVIGGTAGPVRLVHGSYLQDWLSRPDDHNWRVESELGGRSRTFADIGVHWCDLVEFVTGHRIVSLVAQLTTAVPKRAEHDGELAHAIFTEDAATIMFTTDGGATGCLVASQVTPGRKNRLWFSVDGSENSLAFDQEQPESLWLGSREQTTILIRGSESMSAEARRLSVLPAGHPQGYQDCFNGFVADVYSGIAGEPQPGMPTFRDGLRAAELTEAVLTSATTRSWVEIPA